MKFFLRGCRLSAIGWLDLDLSTSCYLISPRLNALYTHILKGTTFRICISMRVKTKLTLFLLSLETITYAFHLIRSHLRYACSMPFLNLRDFQLDFSIQTILRNLKSCQHHIDIEMNLKRRNRVVCEFFFLLNLLIVWK